MFGSILNEIQTKTTKYNNNDTTVNNNARESNQPTSSSSSSSRYSNKSITSNSPRPLSNSAIADSKDNRDQSLRKVSSQSHSSKGQSNTSTTENPLTNGNSNNELEPETTAVRRLRMLNLRKLALERIALRKAEEDAATRSDL